MGKEAVLVTAQQMGREQEVPSSPPFKGENLKAWESRAFLG